MRVFLALAAFSASALWGNYAAAQAPGQTPALQAEIETVYTLPDGREIRNKGHFYRSRTGQVREDSALGAVITDLGAGTVTILVAETKEARVIRIPVDQRVRPVQSNRPAPEVFGETTVAGHRVVKARTRGPQGQRVEFWTARDLGVITWTKTEAAGFTTSKELRNLSTEEPNPALFAIPADYALVEQEMRLGEGPQKGLPTPQGSKRD